MSRNNGSNGAHRDYGATSSSVNTITTIPDVNFSGFSPTEFMSLSENIGHNINSVKSSWMQLEKALKQIESRGINQSIHDKIQKIQFDTNLKIQTTSKDLQRLTNVVRRGDKPQKLQLEKLTSDFRTVIKKYSDNQQIIATKMKQFYLQQQQIANGQQQDEDAAAGNAVTGFSEIEKQQLIREQKELRKNLEFEQEMLIDRETRFKEIEANVLDVNQIMRDLGSIVTQQGENIDTIESSIDHSAAEVEAGAAEMQKAAEYRTRYRKKILILLVIAVIIGLIVTGIIVSKLKS